MTLVIAVSAIQGAVGAIQLCLSVATDAGHSVGTDVVLDTSLTASQMRTRVETAAKAALQTAHGVTVTSTDTVRLIGTI